MNPESPTIYLDRNEIEKLAAGPRLILNFVLNNQDFLIETMSLYNFWMFTCAMPSNNQDLTFKTISLFFEVLGCFCDAFVSMSKAYD